MISYDIQLIIFSKDRPMQLHALLESVHKNCNIFRYVTVQYTYSDDRFNEGYNLARREFGSKVTFVREKNFKMSLVSQLSPSCPYTCFMVDDMICYRELSACTLYPLPDIDEVAFSLRLGNNIKGFETTKWNWKECKHHHFNYPFSVDGNIFRTREISGYIQERDFSNPNKLEVKLQKFKNVCGEYMSCHEQSYCVSIPVNAVSDNAVPVHGEYFPQDTMDLCKRYLDGERIDWENMDYSGIKIPHKEIEFKFRQNDSTQ